MEEESYDNININFSIMGNAFKTGSYNNFLKITSIDANVNNFFIFQMFFKSDDVIMTNI